ncbi:MAG: hypothetical protein NC225_05200 [Clostridium sp.]|nr:hypothetical protein [Clostridium sp.]MCM1458506.1 hypothetical protein [Bacteroides sp.]
MKKEKTRFIFLILLMVFIECYGIWCLITGIGALASKTTGNLFDNEAVNTYVSGETAFAAKVCEYKHSINFIPVGTEYYYAVVDESGTNYCIVRANKSWYKDNFGSNGFAAQKVVLEGRITKYQSKVKNLIEQHNIDLAENGIQFNTSNYVDLSYAGFAWCKVIGGAFLLAGFLMAVYIIRVKKPQDHPMEYKSVQPSGLNSLGYKSVQPFGFISIMMYLIGCILCFWILMFY